MVVCIFVSAFVESLSSRKLGGAENVFFSDCTSEDGFGFGIAVLASTVEVSLETDDCSLGVTSVVKGS